MYFVPQILDGDCGITCLKILLANVYKDERYLYMPFDESHNQYNYKDLSKISKENGVELSGFKVKDKEEISKCRLPAIVRLINKDKKSHAVLINKIKGNKIYYLDPSAGQESMYKDQFYNYWDATGLFISSVEKVDYNYDPIEPLKPIHKVVAFLLQIVSGILIALGIYFVNPNGPYLNAIIFFGGGVLLELFLRIYLFYLMKIIDDYFMKNYDYIKSNSYYDYFVRTQEFKKEYLSSGLNIIYSILVSTFIIFITVFNNIYNFPLVITPIVIASFESLILSKKERSVNKVLTKKENDLKKNTNRQDMLIKVKELQLEAYEYGKNRLAYRYIGILVLFLISILVNVLTDSFTLSNIIFSLCIQIFLYQNLVPILNVEKKQQSKYINKSKISNLFFNTIKSNHNLT